MSEKEMTKEEKEFIEREITIKNKDILEFNPMKTPLPVGTIVWDEKHQPIAEYVSMMKDLIMLCRFIGKAISEGPETIDSMTKRCATLSVVLAELINSVAIDGWHLYGVTSELQLNTYMALGGKQRTIELLQMISKINQVKAEKNVGSYVQ